MAIRIVTDSTCDLPPEVIQRHEIAVIPILIHSGRNDYRTGLT